MIEMKALEFVSEDQIIPEEIIVNFLEENSKVLYVGDFDILKCLKNCDIIKSSNLNLLKNLKEKYDYIIFTEILETIDNPQELIREIKNNSEAVIIYEYKFDNGFYSNKEWKKPWTTIGLEFFLGREFDFLNSIFLGYGTIHICKQPYDYENDE